MTFNQFTKTVGIYQDRPAWHAYVTEQGLAGADLSRDEWFDWWLDYCLPIDGSTPQDVMEAPHEHPVIEGRDIAGI